MSNLQIDLHNLLKTDIYFFNANKMIHNLLGIFSVKRDT